MIRAMFFDLDGTLLNTEKKISSKTRTALQKCQENGIKLFIATARPPLLDRMLSWDKNTLSLFAGGSYYNGGCIKIGEHKDYITISDEVIDKTVSCVCDYDNLNIALQLVEEQHAIRFPLEDKGYKSWGVTAEEALTINQASSIKVVKMLIFYSNLIDSKTPIDEKLVSVLNLMFRDKAKIYLTDKGRCIQIMAQGVDKLSSIESIRKTLCFEKDEIAVFGDDINDMEMLSEYEYSVAMGNAENYIKDAAKFTTLDNDNDGIYHAVHNILKLV